MPRLPPQWIKLISFLHLQVWCNFFRASSKLGSWSGMLKTPLQCSCLSGLHTWCQHSWASSEACTHILAVDVSIKIAQHFTQIHCVPYLHSAVMICAEPASSCHNFALWTEPNLKRIHLLIRFFTNLLSWPCDFDVRMMFLSAFFHLYILVDVL